MKAHVTEKQKKKTSKKVKAKNIQYDCKADCPLTGQYH